MRRPPTNVEREPRITWVKEGARRPGWGRILAGFGWGVVATLAMTAFMILGMVTGIAPMPQPIPIAVVATTLGEGLPQPMLMLLGIAAHLFYGGFWGAVLAGITYPVTLWKGIGLGIFLWAVMQVVVLPFLGWGFFGMSVTPLIAGATLILHLIYGATLGWLMDRKFRWLR